MDGVDRIIGELREFKRSSENRMDDVHADIKELRTDVKRLNEFKWRVAGGAAVLSVVLAAVSHFIFN